MRNKTFIASLFSLLVSVFHAQFSENCYLKAYSKLQSMLKNSDSLDFKKAIFLTENAYFDNQLNQETFKQNTYICF
jgi:hypothetical protein